MLLENLLHMNILFYLHSDKNLFLLYMEFEQRKINNPERPHYPDKVEGGRVQISIDAANGWIIFKEFGTTNEIIFDIAQQKSNMSLEDIIVNDMTVRTLQTNIIYLQTVDNWIDVPETLEKMSFVYNNIEKFYIDSSGLSLSNGYRLQYNSADQRLEFVGGGAIPQFYISNTGAAYAGTLPIYDTLNNLTSSSTEISDIILPWNLGNYTVGQILNDNLVYDFVTFGDFHTRILGVENAIGMPYTDIDTISQRLTDIETSGNIDDYARACISSTTYDYATEGTLDARLDNIDTIIGIPYTDPDTISQRLTDLETTSIADIYARACISSGTYDYATEGTLDARLDNIDIIVDTENNIVETAGATERSYLTSGEIVHVPNTSIPARNIKITGAGSIPCLQFNDTNVYRLESTSSLLQFTVGNGTTQNATFEIQDGGRITARDPSSSRYCYMDPVTSRIDIYNNTNIWSMASDSSLFNIKNGTATPFYVNTLGSAQFSGTYGMRIEVASAPTIFWQNPLHTWKCFMDGFEFLIFSYDGTNLGYLSPAGSNTQMNFTGAHTCTNDTQNPDDLEIGQCVYMTGDICSLEELGDWEALPVVTNNGDKKKFYGIYLEYIEGTKVEFKQGIFTNSVDKTDERYWIGAHGNMRALAYPDIYEAGDYLIPDGKYLRKSDTPNIPLIRCIQDIELTDVGKIAIEI